MSINHESPEISQGFLYAFYHYSQSHRRSLFEKLVSIATASDCVHVAIAPVLQCLYDPETKRILKLELANKVYTAFMGRGYEIQTVDAILNDSYEYIFLPTDPVKFNEGIAFLDSLQGLRYNYLALPLTVLPSFIKPTVHSNHQNTPHSIICSQMGLMLFNQSVNEYNSINPAMCTPGELKETLLQRSHCIRCDSNVFQINQN
jgi:hypothetical protein